MYKRQVDADIGELRAEMKGEFKEVYKRMESGFARFDRKFDRLMWGLVTVSCVIISALIGLIGALIHSPVL